MDIRLIDDMIEINRRPVARLINSLNYGAVDDLREAIDYAADGEEMEREHNKAYDEAEEEGYDRGYEDAKRDLRTEMEAELETIYERAQAEIKEKYAALVEAASKLSRAYYNSDVPFNDLPLAQLVEDLAEKVSEVE